MSGTKLLFKVPVSLALSVASRIIGRVQQRTVKLFESINQLKPRQLALIVNVEGGFEFFGVFERRSIEMHPTRIVISFKTNGRSACIAKVSVDAFGAFKRAGIVASPFKVL